MITKLEVSSQNLSAPVLPVGAAMPNDDPVQIRNIEGLGPVKANIASTPWAIGRGEFYQGSSTGTRNIVLTLGLNPNWYDQTISGLRRLLYAYFMPEQISKLRFFTDDYPVVDIEGIVEGFEPNIFSQDPEFQISIMCHSPDFVDPDSVIIKGIVTNALVDGLPTEYVFEYEGTAPTGFNLRVRTTPSKTSYTGRLVVVNKSPIVYEVFDINPMTVDLNTRFHLTTLKTGRRVETIETAQTVDPIGTVDLVTDLLSKMVPNSKWPELKPGENVFSVGAMQSGLTYELVYSNRFGGL